VGIAGGGQVKFLLTSTVRREAEDPHWCPKLMAQRYSERAEPVHTLVDEPEEADAIVFVEPVCVDAEEGILCHELRAHPWVRAHPAKCFVADVGESPVGWLPGAYTSMPRSRFDPSRFRAMGFLMSTNPLVGERAHERHRTPRRLCTFRGARMPGVRASLLEHAGWGEDVEVVETPFLENWVPGDKLAYRNAYVDSILDSRFVLCPRGYATSTFRMYEAMQLGRVPVVLSDAWTAPRGPDWDTCVLRVAEAEWSRLPAILRAAEPRWASMAEQARSAWEEWFSDRAHVARVLDWIAELARGPRPDEREVRARWRVLEFVAENVRRQGASGAPRADPRTKTSGQPTDS